MSHHTHHLLLQLTLHIISQSSRTDDSRSIFFFWWYLTLVDLLLLSSSLTATITLLRSTITNKEVTCAPSHVVKHQIIRTGALLWLRRTTKKGHSQSCISSIIRRRGGSCRSTWWEVGKFLANQIYAKSEEEMHLDAQESMSTKKLYLEHLHLVSCPSIQRLVPPVVVVGGDNGDDIRTTVVYAV